VSDAKADLRPRSATATVPIACARMVFRRAQHQIDHLLATAMQPDLRIECAWDVVFQAGRDLDRLAAKHDRADVLTIRLDRAR
jgi:hypothetical protein